MIPQPFEYSAPDTLGEVLALLAAGARPLAGGHSLIPLMKLRLSNPEHLVDLNRVTELNFVRDEDGSIRIGAMITHYQIETSELLRRKCPLLPETAAHIGDVQVRNMGTLGGSLAHGDPAADYPAALIALDASVRLVGANSDRTVRFEEFLLDPFTTALEPGELIYEVIVPAEEPGTGVSYQKMVHPASGFAIVGAAARVRKSGDRIAVARVGVTGIGPKAYRAANIERLLEGTTGSPEEIGRACQEADAGIEAQSDLAASAEYRRHLSRVYTARAVSAGLARTAPS